MSCCGKLRTQFTSSVSLNLPPVGSVAFEYTGASRLTVIGPVTHMRYDFDAPGARVNVDRRDAGALEMIRSLRRV
jgi:hypothetical protein